MNYNFLYPNKPLPSYYRIIALIVGMVIITLGIYLKISNSNDFYGMTPNLMKVIFFFALLIFITSKNSFEDERTIELRLQIFRIGFGLLLGFISIFELSSVLNNNPDAYKYFFHWVISILGFQALFFELSKNSNLIDFVERNHFLYKLATLITLLLMFFFSKWLWTL